MWGVSEKLDFHFIAANVYGYSHSSIIDLTEISSYGIYVVRMLCWIFGCNGYPWSWNKSRSWCQNILIVLSSNFIPLQSRNSCEIWKRLGRLSNSMRHPRKFAKKNSWYGVIHVCCTYIFSYGKYKSRGISVTNTLIFTYSRYWPQLHFGQKSGLKYEWMANYDMIDWPSYTH